MALVTGSRTAKPMKGNEDEKQMVYDTLLQVILAILIAIATSRL